MSTDAKVWLDGAIVDADAARVSPFDHGLLVGDGVFETLRVYGGVPFAWRRHHERLVESAAGLALALPDASTLRAAVDAVIGANGIDEGRLRITVTGGPAPLGSERGESPPTVIVAVTQMTPWPPSAAVVTVEWLRNERSATAGIKTISYAENVRALAAAHERGASEALFCNTRGELCEATGSNVFLVTRSTVVTPSADSGCLRGVTRALVLELCAQHRIDVEDRAVAPTELTTCDEAFLTSSTREVQPISHIDDRELARVPGPVTERLAALFRELVAENLDP